MSPPLAEKYFDRSTPLDAVKMFQYSVEADQFNTTYSCIDRDARAQISKTKLKLALKFYSDQSWEGLTARQLIVGATRHLIYQNGTEAGVLLEYHQSVALPAVLVRDGDEWLIHLEKTFQYMLEPTAPAVPG